MKPEELRYTDEHEWMEDGKSPAPMGITDYAQKELTDVVFVELPEAGREVEKGEEIVTLESVKATSDVYAPANGTITGVNSDLEANPQKVNQDPYGEGWLVEIEISDQDAISELMDFEDYEKFLEEAE